MPSFKAIVLASTVTYAGMSLAAPIGHADVETGLPPCIYTGTCGNLPTSYSQNAKRDDGGPVGHADYGVGLPPCIYTGTCGGLAPFWKKLQNVKRDGGDNIGPDFGPDPCIFTRTCGGLAPFWKKSLDTRILHPCSSVGECNKVGDIGTVDDVVYQRSDDAEDENLKLRVRIVHPCSLSGDCSPAQWEAGNNGLIVYRRAEDGEKSGEPSLNTRIVHPCMVSGDCTTTEEWEAGNEGLIVYRSEH